MPLNILSFHPADTSELFCFYLTNSMEQIMNILLLQIENIQV